MKVFSSKENHSEKINFVDDKNVFVGYDSYQCCCEQADWFIADELTLDMLSQGDKELGLEGYNFDPSYCEAIAHIDGEKDYNGNSTNQLYEGAMVVFKLTKGKKEKFLHLYNCHNGYYSHGFTLTDGKDIIHEGSL